MIRAVFGIISAVLIFGFSPAYAGETAVERGMRLFNKGDYPQAMRAFHLSKTQDLNKEAYVAWGLSAFYLGKYESALLKLNKAYSIDPGDGGLRTLIGECYLKLNKPAEALRKIRATEKLKVKDRGAADFIWAVSAGLAGSHEEAIGKFKSALTAKPEKEFEIRLGMADSLKALNRLAEAGEELELALRLRPSDPNALGRLGLIRLKTGRYEESVKLLESAVKADPASGVNQYNLACAQARFGQSEKACGALKSALSLGVEKNTIRNDEDLTSLKGERCFEELMK